MINPEQTTISSRVGGCNEAGKIRVDCVVFSYDRDENDTMFDNNLQL